MKRIVLGLLSLAANVALSQITLEKKYGAGDYLRTTSIESIDDKYVKISATNLNAAKSMKLDIVLYNSNHSIYKSFSTPEIAVGAKKTIYYYNGIGHFSTKLFNLDESIEYSIAYNILDSTNFGYSSFYYVYNELGQQIFACDSAVESNLGDGYGIAKIDGSYKLILNSQKKSDGAQWFRPSPTAQFQVKAVPLIYSLPGTLPDITTSLNSQDLDKAKAHLSLPNPNPSQDITRIEYQLPTDAAFGEITVYNNMGFKLKSYKVDNTFGDLLLNNQDLPTGQYYYHLVANGKRIGSQKMLVIK